LGKTLLGGYYMIFHVIALLGHAWKNIKKTKKTIIWNIKVEKICLQPNI
jgi:hypothetical protein